MSELSEGEFELVVKQSPNSVNRIEVGKMRFNFVVLFLLLTAIASAIPLNEVSGIKKLSNCNE